MKIGALGLQNGIIVRLRLWNTKIDGEFVKWLNETLEANSECKLKTIFVWKPDLRKVTIGAPYKNEAC